MNTDLLMKALLIFTFFWWAYGIGGRGRQEGGGLFVPLSSSVKDTSITSSSGFRGSLPESTRSPFKVYITVFVFPKLPGKPLHLYSELWRKEKHIFFPFERYVVCMHLLLVVWEQGGTVIKGDSEVESSFIHSWELVYESSFIHSWEPVQAGVLDFRGDLHYSGTVWPSWCTYVQIFFFLCWKKEGVFHALFIYTY